jgi:hypothetical protein
MKELRSVVEAPLIEKKEEIDFGRKENGEKRNVSDTE